MQPHLLILRCTDEGGAVDHGPHNCSPTKGAAVLEPTRTTVGVTAAEALPREDPSEGTPTTLKASWDLQEEPLCDLEELPRAQPPWSGRPGPGRGRGSRTATALATLQIFVSSQGERWQVLRSRTQKLPIVLLRDKSARTIPPKPRLSLLMWLSQARNILDCQ